MLRRFLRHKVIRDKGLLLIFPKPPIFSRLLPGTFVGNVILGFVLTKFPGLSVPFRASLGHPIPSRPSLSACKLPAWSPLRCPSLDHPELASFCIRKAEFVDVNSFMESN